MRSPSSSFSPFLAVILFVTAAFAPLERLQAAERPPNIIFVLADDLAQGDLGCYGQKLIQTPRLDRMAAEGVLFQQAYSGTSVCAPSRASLMTGLHLGHSPIRGNREIKPEGQFPIPEGTLTVAQVLRSSGYATACVGKWGMGMFNTSGSPLAVGFDHFYGYNCQRQAHSYFPSSLFADDQRVPIPGNQGGAKGTYAQDLLQKDALDWIRKHKDAPFFLFYALTLPHGQYEIVDLGIYKDKPWSEKEKTYAAMVTRMDTDVGHLLDLLVELELDSNTLVMFSGDNGSAFAPSSPVGKRFDQSMGGKLRGYKRSLYEGGLRQAAMARWPGTIPPGRVSTEPWAFWDVLPTFAELAGAALPDGFREDGLSLVQFLKGGSAPARKYFYWELNERGFRQAVRFDDWKAVIPDAGKPIEIYDLAVDSAESRNLAPDRPELVAKARSFMEEARIEDPNWPSKKSGKPSDTPED